MVYFCGIFQKICYNINRDFKGIEVTIKFRMFCTSDKYNEHNN